MTTTSTRSPMTMLALPLAPTSPNLSPVPRSVLLRPHIVAPFRGAWRGRVRNNKRRSRPFELAPGFILEEGNDIPSAMA
jgi:hypothetical protein